jgi:hypothetical protein
MNMRMKFYLMALAMLTAFTGCQDHSQPQDAAKPADGQELKQKYTDAVNGTKDFTAQKKDEFLATMGQKMKDLDARMDQLAKKSEGYKDDAKTEADKAMAALRGQRDALGKKCDALKKTGQDAWEKARAGVASAWGDMEKAFENAKSRFK